MTYRFIHLVVVHGIGDQKSNETVINFMNEFVRAMPAPIRETVEIHNLVERNALETDAAGAPKGRPAYLLLSDGGASCAIAFSEVYWQPVTNEYLDKHHQPPIPIFSWAHSVNLRLQRGGENFRRGREAIDNLEKMLNLFRRLAAIYKRSGLLADVLERFLGDVEMYVEDDNLRARINDRFFEILDNDGAVAAEVLRQLNQVAPPGGHRFAGHEVYIVAHSEGTVVSYNCLVEAARRREEHSGEPKPFAWLERVCGLVTLGSPLDKHYSIWRNRFRTTELTRPVNPRIRWFNYWDRSDPVGYGLKALNPGDPASDAARMFTIEYDRGFARYPIPGAAHVGYWTDPEIHLDILQNMMHIGGPRSGVTGSRWWGREWLMNGGDRAAYLLVRGGGLLAALFFLIRLLEPLRVKAGAVKAGLCGLPGLACGDAPPRGVVAWIALLAWVFVPAALLKLWHNLEAERDRRTGGGTLVRSILLGAWLAALALVVPTLRDPACAYGCASTGLKDLAGYALGLFLVCLLWQLHTTFHRGLVELWRYTAGYESQAEESRTVAPE